MDSNWFVESALATASCVGIGVNLLVIFIFIRKPGLRTISNRFVLNLLITNLISSTILIPLLLADEISKQTNINPTPIDSTIICHISEGVSNLICTASILSILLIAIDQYFAVVHPLRYHTRIDQCKSLLLIITAWFISIILGIIGGLTPTGSLWHFCKSTNTTSPNSLRMIYSILYFIFVILVPFVTISILYLSIYTAAHRNSERMRHSGSITINIEAWDYEQVPIKKVNSVPLFNLTPAASLQKSPSAEVITNRRKSSNFMTALKYRISNASLFRYREETRAVKISVIIILMVLVCYLPYGVILILNNFNFEIEIFNTIALVHLSCASVLSPFLFAYRNRRIKREIYKIFHPAKLDADLQRLKHRTMNMPSHVAPFLTPPSSIQPILAEQNKSILKKVCNKTKIWNKKCNFILTVPDSCAGVECRSSFSSQNSTQMSTTDSTDDS